MKETKSDSNQNKNTIKILIVDDHPLLRQALRIVLEKQPDFRVVAEAGNGEEAVRFVTQTVPDVVIMDIGMPIMNGLEATRLIKEKCPQVAILVLTVHADSEHILSIFEAGASGYLIKSVFGEEIVNAVRAVVTGENILSPQVFKQILKHANQYITKPISLGTGEKLTVREIEILKLAAMGMSNKDIALKLNLSLPTIKNYLVDIFSKLNVRSRTEAVISGMRTGFLSHIDQ